MMPLYSGASDAAFIVALISSYVASFSSLHVRSTTDTSGVGTRKAIPVSLPLSEGKSLPPRDGPSTVSWVAVIACTVVMRPSTMPNLSFTTFASGARQFVVHDALLTTWRSDLYSVWFTPQTNIGTSSFGGAEMITFLQPPPR